MMEMKIVFFISNWRRLKKTKLAFISDVFHSTLASSLIDLHRFPPKYIKQPHLKEFYAIRVIAGLNSSQKNAEMLLDFKYLALGSLSKYANLSKLLPDKFGPIYSNHLSIWLVHTFWNFCKNVIIQKNTVGKMAELNTPVFLDEKRTAESLGGELDLPAIWTKNFRLRSFEHFLSSLHTYVHTPKEPNSTFYENVKCLNTILKYKQLYLDASYERRWGFSDPKTIQELYKDNTFGFSSVYLYNAVKQFQDDNPIDYYRLLDNEVFRIPIAHFNSTKASISTFNREKDCYDRCKVHDALVKRIDINTKTLFEVAKDTLSDPNYKPLADMCIKEQYGAKREFYVIDLESKMIVKALEEFFKKICREIPTECISVPGDMKMLKVQENVNRIIQHAKHNKQNAYYINGDCSKWSASEVMESFQVTIFAMKDNLPSFYYNLMMAILESWKNKELQIPAEIRNKTVEKSEFIEYMFEDDEKLYRIKLEQNFLMGLFNYLSSYKASVSNNFMKKTIEARLPNVKLLHLEHSDDYIWFISCKPEQIFWIKTKISKLMRLGSVTDSDKKTSVSEFYCEFVSLFSFNGHMVTPIIKKTKEISSALTGEGYQSDMAAVASRTAEIVRIGCTMTEALFFHKIHCWQLASLYSLLPGQRNYDSIYSLHEKPVEFFGLSEVHPLLYFCNKGDVNNLRLYKHGSKNSLQMLQIIMKPENNSDEMDELTTMEKPKFSYIHDNRKLRKMMQNLGIDHEENQEFLDKYPIFQIYKPRSKMFLDGFLKSFYSMRSFQKAYENSGRLQILLRAAYFTSKICISYSLIEGKKSIQQFIHGLPEMCRSAQYYTIREEFLTNGDSAATIFYQLIEASQFSHEKYSKMKKIQLYANRSPYLYNSLKIDTPADILLLKHFNPDIYEMENIKQSRRWDMDTDLQTLNKLEAHFKELPPRDKIMLLYKNLTAYNKPDRMMMLPFSEKRELIDFYRCMIQEQTSHYCKCFLNQVRTIEFVNPIATSLRSFHFKSREIPLERALLLTCLSLYGTLKFKPPFYKVAILRTYFEKMDTLMGISAFEFIKNFGPLDMQYFQCTRNEIHSAILMKMDLCPNLSHLDDLIKMNIGYTYKYAITGKFMNGTWIGDTICDFKVSNTHGRISWFEDIHASIVCLNQTSLSSVGQAFLIGQVLIQKLMYKDLKNADPTTLLKTQGMSLINFNALMNKFRQAHYRHSQFKNNFHKLKVLVSDETGDFNFVCIDTYKKTHATYYPVILNEHLKTHNRIEAGKMNIETGFEVNLNTLTLISKPGEWVIAKFSFLNFWADSGVIKNVKDFTIGGVRLDYIINDLRLQKIVLQKNETFNLNNIMPAIVLEEVEAPKKLKIDKIDFSNAFTQYFDITNIYKPASLPKSTSEKATVPTSFSSFTSDDFSNWGGDIVMNDDALLALTGDFDESMFADMELMGFDTMAFNDDSTSDEDIDYSGFVPSHTYTEGNKILRYDTKKENKSRFIERFSATFLWEDILFLAIDHLKDQFGKISKICYFLLFLISVKFPKFSNSIDDKILKHSLAKIWSMMKTIPVVERDEYFEEFGISLTLIVNEEKKIISDKLFMLGDGHKVKINGLKICNPNPKIPDQLKHKVTYHSIGSSDWLINSELTPEELGRMIEKIFTIPFLETEPRYSTLTYIFDKANIKNKTKDIIDAWF